MTATVIRGDNAYSFKGTLENFHKWIKELEDKLEKEGTNE